MKASSNGKREHNSSRRGRGARAASACVALFTISACLGERPSGSIGADAGDNPAGSGGAGNSGGGGDGGGGNASGSATDAGADAMSGDAGVLPGVPAALAFNVINGGYASSPLLVAVSIRDGADALVATATHEVTLRMGNNPGGSELIGYTTARARAGVAVFDAVGLDQVGSGYTLTATAEGLPEAVSAPFDVVRLPFERVATGLYGGSTTHLAISNEPAPTLFVSGPAGVFRSRNNGGAWEAANFGNGGSIGLVMVDPENPARVYATPSFGSGSFSGAGFYATKSDNGGDAWRSMSGLVDGLDGAQIGTFAIDPNNSNIVYAGNPFGIFRSADAGETWIETSFPYANYALTIDPVTPSTLYAYAYDQDNFEDLGIYKSIDSGGIWVPVNYGDLPANYRVSRPPALLATPTAVFAGSYRSVNAGASWENMGLECWAFAYSGANVNRLYCGRSTSVRTSNDGGLTFGAEVATGGGLINSLAVDPNDANRVYAATESGVYASIDGGLTWAVASTGITNVALGGAVMNPTSSDILYVGGPEGVFRTDNGGVTWLLSPLNTSVQAVTLDPANSNVVYACGNNGQFFRSDNAGVDWGTGVSTGGGFYCYDIVVRGTTIWLPTVTGSVLRSTDGGATFNPTGLTAPTYSVAADPTGQIVYAGTNQGTYKSENGGVDWTLMTNDLADAFLVDQTNPSNVYMGLGCGSGTGASSNGGTRRSTNAGVDWEPVVQGSCIQSLTRLGDGRLVAVGRGFPAFSISSDQGQTWAGGGIGIDGEPSGVALSSDGQIVYVPTTLGMYKSISGGL